MSGLDCHTQPNRIRNVRQYVYICLIVCLSLYAFVVMLLQWQLNVCMYFYYYFNEIK